MGAFFLSQIDLQIASNEYFCSAKLTIKMQAWNWSWRKKAEKQYENMVN